jgi:uncharacterized protein (TIRG00374 family)
MSGHGSGDHEEADPAPKPTRVQPFGPMRRAAFLLAFMLLAGVVLFSMQAGEIADVAKHFGQTRLLWVLAGSAAQIFAFLSLALLWKTALRRLGSDGGIGDLFLLSLGKLFADQALPSVGVSGGYFIVHAFARRGAPERVGLAVFAFGAAAMIVMFILAVIASFILVTVSGAGPEFLTIETASLALLAFVALSVFLAYWLLQSSLVRRFQQTNPFAQRLTDLSRFAIERLMRDKALFVRCVVLQIAGRLFDAATLWTCFLAIEQTLDPHVAFAAVSMAALAATIAPTPMGLGSFEGGMVASLTSLGAPIEAALTATILYRGLSLWLPLAAGFIIVNRELLILQPKKAKPGPK